MRISTKRAVGVWRCASPTRVLLMERLRDMATDTKQETGFQFKDQRLGVARWRTVLSVQAGNQRPRQRTGGPPLSEFVQKVVDGLRKEMPYFQREGGYA